MSKYIVGQIPGRAVAHHLCNFCTSDAYAAPDQLPVGWLELGRDGYLCPACAVRRARAAGLLDKLAALPPVALDAVVRVVDNLVQSAAGDGLRSRATPAPLGAGSARPGRAPEPGR